DEAFFRGLRAYYRAHANGTASSEDLRAALEKSSHTDLRAFFARWVYDSGHPQYELSWEWMSRKQSSGSKRSSGDGELRVNLKQLQPGNVFLDPVPIAVRTASGSHDFVLKPTGQTTTVTIQFPEKPTAIELDPRNT